MDQTAKGLPPPPATAGGGAVNNLNLWNGYMASPRSYSYKRSTTLGYRSVRGYRYEVATPENRLRRRQANREIVRRALTPPSHKPSCRWRNFSPTPSRLCNMSMA